MKIIDDLQVAQRSQRDQARDPQRDKLIGVEA